jgi:hypothetical protein
MVANGLGSTQKLLNLGEKGIYSSNTRNRFRGDYRGSYCYGHPMHNAS